MLLLIPYWKGYTRSMWKCYTYQKPILNIDWTKFHVYVHCYHIGEQGALAPLEENHTFQSDEICVWPIWGAGPLRTAVMTIVLLLEVEGRVSCRTSSWMWGSWYFPKFLVEGWVIDTDEHGLLDGPGDAMYFPAYNGEAVHTDKVSCRVTVLVNREGALWCSFSLFPKVLPDFPMYS